MLVASSMKKQREEGMGKKTRLISSSALFSSLTIVLTVFVKIPLGNGYIHLGDSMIYLASCILPTPYAAISAAISGAASDIIGGFAVFAIPSALIKAMITLPFTSKGDTILSKRNALMTIPAGGITIICYFIVCLILYSWSGAIIGLLGDAMQTVVSAAVYLAFASALDKAKFKENLLGSQGNH